MTVRELAQRPDFTLLTGETSLDKPVGHIFCCDLLSVAMSKAPIGCVWVTVMGNVNSIAVAVLTDAACIVLAEGMALDAVAAEKAAEQDVAVLSTSLPVFDASLLVHQLAAQL